MSTCLPVHSQSNQNGPDVTKASSNGETLPKGVPDVQVMVGPGARGHTVAFVFPKKVDTKLVRMHVDRFVELSGAPVSGLTIETSRLEHEAGAKIAKEPLMTSATFETKAELVGRQAGAFIPEKLILALDQYDRIQVTFLVEQAFVYEKARHFENENLVLDVFGQQGAFTFVANIRKRPVADFVIPDQDVAVTRTKPQRKSSMAIVWVVFALAIAAGLTVMKIVKQNVGR
ncbi:MAG: hypothetical protein ACKO14_15080 [Armatimonadota bacterium]